MDYSKKLTVLKHEYLENRRVLSDFQWGLSAIEIPDNITIKNNDVVVAVIDSGIDLNHNDLKNNIWTNPFEKADGIDNDNNGYVDDIHGWNFAYQNNNVQDDYYHGTHVSGIIAAENNSIGIKGVASAAKIMSIKFQNSNGLGYTGAAVSSINYAIKMKNQGVNIAAINLSWGGGTSVSLSLQKAIQNASDNNIIVVSAAGNNGNNNDISPRYPSSYKFNNTISVAAVGSDYKIASFSNYGKNSVNVGAPGTSIYSTLPNNNYGYVSGSSMAAPFVSGAVALLRGLNYSISSIKSSIINGAFMFTGLADKVEFGFVNIKRSLDYLIKNSVDNSATDVVNVPSEPHVVNNINYSIDILSKYRIKGWATDITNSNKRLLIQVTINDIHNYSRKANMLRSDIGGRFGFNIKFNSSNFVKGNNKVSIKIIDPISDKSLLVNRTIMV